MLENYINRYFEKDYRLDVNRLNYKGVSGEDIVQQALLNIWSKQPKAKDYNHFVSILRRKIRELTIDTFRTRHEASELTDDLELTTDGNFGEINVNIYILDHKDLTDLEKDIIQFALDNGYTLSDRKPIIEHFKLTTYTYVEKILKHIRKVASKDL